MNLAVFFRKFGGSARTKNICNNPDSLPEGDPGRNKRRFDLPKRSGLPPEFIRLCPWELEYLFTIARRARRGIVETGRFNGGSTFAMACAAPDVPVYSIDIAPQDDDRLRALMRRHEVGATVTLIVGDSQKTKYPEIKEFDLLFVDGDHTYEGCLGDLTNWYDRLLPNGHLLVHDSYLGRWGVQDAVADFLDQHPELQVVQSPFIGPSYWHYPAGSFAHFIKRHLPNVRQEHSSELVRRGP